jgi:hypothetical protein
MDFGNGRARHGGKREQGKGGADHGEPPNASPVQLITHRERLFLNHSACAVLTAPLRRLSWPTLATVVN